VNSATLKIAVEVDSATGEVKLKQLGATAEDAGKKGEDGGRRMGRSLGEIDGIAGKAANALKGIAVAGAAIAGVAVVGGLYMLTGALRESVQLASDMEEAQSKFNTVFGALSAQAEQWAGELRDSYHMSTLDAKKYLAAMQDLLVPMGMNKQAAAEMSFEVVKLSADLGSFNNLPTAQVMDDIQSALVGNYETMKKYGVNEATVQEKALAMGLAKTKDEITAADKAQAAYQLIIEGSTAAMGDSIRTADGFANQMRDLEATVTELKIAAGGALLPVINELVTGLNDWLRANEELVKSKIREWVSNLIPIIRGMGEAIVWTIEQVDNWRVGYGKLIEIFGTSSAEAAAKEKADNEVRLGYLRRTIEIYQEYAASEKLTGERRLHYAELAARKQGELNTILGVTSSHVKEGGAAASEAAPQFENLGKKTDDSAKAAKKHADELQNLLDKYLPLKKEAEDVAAAEAGLKELRASGTITLEEYQRALENVRKSTVQYKDDEQKLAEAIKKTEERVKEKQKADEEAVKAAADLSKAYMDIYDEMADSSAAMSQASYEAQVESLDKQLEAYRKMGVDENLLRQLREKRERELYKKMQMSSGTFFGGVVAAAMDAEDAMKTMADVGYEAFNMLTDTFSNTFVAVMKGEFDSIGDLWNSLLDNLLDMFIKFIADLVAQWVMSGIVGMITGQGTGGFSIGGMLGGGTGIGGGGGFGGGLGSLTTLYSGYQYLTGGSGLVATELSGVTVGGAVGGGGGGAAIGGGAAGGGAAVAETGGAGGAGAAGSMSWTGPAAVAVIGAMLWAKFQMRPDVPPLAELLNSQGIGPDYFADVVGESFKAAVNPITGGTQAMMLDAESAILAVSKTLGLGIRATGDEVNDVMLQVFDQATGQWVDLGKEIMAFGVLADNMGEDAAAAMIEAKSGVVGLAEELLDISSAQENSLDLAIDSMEDLGIEGADLKSVLGKVGDVMSGVAKDTGDLRAELYDLGLAADQTDNIISQLGLDVFDMSGSLDDATGSLRSFANTAGTLDYGLYDLETAIGSVHVAVRTAADGMTTIAEDTVSDINNVLDGLNTRGASGRSVNVAVYLAGNDIINTKKLDARIAVVSEQAAVAKARRPNMATRRTLS